MEKHWYDYLWIVSLAYLILGFFNILFAWIGLLCFFIPLIISLANGTKGYCTGMWKRQLFGLIGGTFRSFPKKDVPLWMKSKWFRYGFLIFFFVMFFQMLWNTGLVFAEIHQLKTGSLPALDIFVPVGLGIPRNTIPSGRRTVCFWILQCHADIYRTWGCNNDLVQTEKLVRLLSDGNNDSAHL